MKILRVLLADASAGFALGLPQSLLLARWTWLEITPGMAFDTGLLIPGGAVAGLVWGLFAAAAKEQPPAWLIGVPVAAVLASFTILGFEPVAALHVPGQLFGEAIGWPGLSAERANVLLGLAMLPALILPLLPGRQTAVADRTGSAPEPAPVVGGLDIRASKASYRTNSRG